MKKVFGLCLAVAFMASVAGASLIISDFNVAVVEDFENWDGLSDPDNWTISGPALKGQGRGSETAGGIYSYGSAGSSDHALGYLPTTAYANATLALSLVNDTGSTIEALDLSFDAEQWRMVLNGRVSTWTVSIVVGGESEAVLYTPAWSTDNSGATGMRDGNHPDYSTTLSASVTSLHIADQEEFQLIWRSTRGSGSGSSQGFAIDNINITAIPEPSTLSLIALFAGVLLLHPCGKE